MRKVFYIFLLLLLCSFANGQVLTDAQFFNVLNLDYQGLEQVKANVRNNNLAKAKKEYVKYLKNRTEPRWYVDWRDFSSQKGKFSVREYIIPNSD